jgi:hypothetical protein
VRCQPSLGRCGVTPEGTRQISPQSSANKKLSVVDDRCQVQLPDGCGAISRPKPATPGTGGGCGDRQVVRRRLAAAVIIGGFTYPEGNSERTPISPVKKGPPRWIRSSAWSESASRCSASASLHLPNEASCPRGTAHQISWDQAGAPPSGRCGCLGEYDERARLRDRRSAQGSSQF